MRGMFLQDLQTKDCRQSTTDLGACHRCLRWNTNHCPQWPFQGLGQIKTIAPGANGGWLLSRDNGDVHLSGRAS